MAEPTKKSFLELMPENLRPAAPVEVESSGGYTEAPLPDGLARQMLDHLASTGKTPGVYVSNPRGKRGTVRKTAGFVLDTNIPLGNGIVAEFRGVVKWAIK